MTIWSDTRKSKEELEHDKFVHSLLQYKLSQLHVGENIHLTDEEWAVCGPNIVGPINLLKYFKSRKMTFKPLTIKKYPDTFRHVKRIS